VIIFIFQKTPRVYNIFGLMNIKEIPSHEKFGRIFRAISSPARILILVGIGKGEACVCHLEALLDMRQAYISQQLMELRDADLLETRRDGRFIFYRLSDPRFLDLLVEIGEMFGISTEDLESLLNAGSLPRCCCPACIAEINPVTITKGEISS